MITKDILKTPLGTELVVSSRVIGRHTNKANKNPEQIREHEASIGQLVSHDTYEESYYKSNLPSHTDWRVSTSDRTKRFIIKFQDTAGSDVFAVIAGADIICAKSEVTVRWAQENAERTQAEQERERKAEAERAVEEKRKATEDALKGAVKANLQELFGANWDDLGIRASYLRTYSDAKLQADGTYLGVLRNSGEVEIPVDLFLKMVHKFSEQ